jgi:hypothetical protein
MLLTGTAVAQPLDPYEPREPYLAPPGEVGAGGGFDAMAPPPPRYRYHVGLTGALRFTNLDTHEAASTDQLLEYGWGDAHGPVMSTLGADIEFLLAPIVDLGLSISRGTGVHADAVGWMEDRVETTATQVAVVARVHWALGRPFLPEPRVDAGLVHRTVRLHDVDASDTLPYLRAGLDWRLGNRRGGVQVSAGYILTGRASSENLDPAIGGLDVGIGPYLRF